MESLLNEMQERLKYLENDKNEMDEAERKWRIRELTLAIIAVQQRLLAELTK
jgi:hypothetical protein